MSTVRALADEARNTYLMSRRREQMNRLNGAITNTATTLTLRDSMTGISVGTILTIDDEDIYVAAAPAAQVLPTIYRGWFGTTAAAHSDNAYVTVNALFPTHAIVRAMNNTARALSSPSNGLFRPLTVPLTGVSGRTGYDLTAISPTVFLDVINVYVREAAGGVRRHYFRNRRWTVLRDAPVADFASGLALFLPRPVPAGNTILVTYAARYGEITTADLATDVNTLAGVQPSVEDILPLGAAIRLITGREPKRSFTETRPESRSAEEVPPGAVVASASGLSRLMQTRIAEERARLQAQYEVYLSLPA